MVEGRQPRAENPGEQAERDKGKCQPGETKGVVLGDSLKEETGPVQNGATAIGFCNKEVLGELG